MLDDRFVRVIWGEYMAGELANRPMGSMRPADLTMTIVARRSPLPRTAAWPFLDLLRACLELRSETDIGLSGTRPMGSADDVGLAG
jgi:hypothetical protein